MTSKKIIALLLTVCMMLSCIPALAATVELNDVEFPEDGTISVVATRTIWESIVTGESARNVLIILDDTTSQIFPYRSTANHYNGFTVSFTATMKNEVMADGIESFTVVDAPVEYARADGGGRACFGVSIENLIEYSPELSVLGDSKFGYTMQESPFTISNLFVGKGTWKPEAVDTGLFPEGTLFLPYQEFLKYPSTFDLTGGYGYSNLIFKNTRTTDGPYQFFVPELSGEYVPYVQLVSNSASLTDRAVKLTIDGAVYEFTPNDYAGTGKLSASMVPTWCYEKSGKNITLTKDKVTAVRLDGYAYGRITALALVPVASATEIDAAIKASPTTTQVNTGDIVSVSVKPYHPAFATAPIKVTVNGDEINTRAGLAARKYDVAYPDVNPVYGLSVRILPETNTFPTYVTALDAIAQYMQAKGKESPVQASAIKNGAISNNAVLVNGKIITDIDWYEIKEGDVITIMTKDNKNAFEPTSIKGFRTIDTSNIGLIEALGTPTTATGNLAGGTIKLCLNQANTASALGSFATAYNENGLENCYVVGYATLRKDNSNAYVSNNGGSNWTNLTGKLYFENVKILGYDSAASASRVDLVIGGKLKFNSQDPRYKDENGEVFTDANGKIPVKPYEYFGDPYLYNWNNVYFVNASTDVSLKATKAGDKYTLTTGGMHVVDIVIATYAEDGTTITETTVMKEQIVMFNAPLDVLLAENQKAFVWTTNMYRGTTMKPAIPTLLGSNFLK